MGDYTIYGFDGQHPRVRMQGTFTVGELNDIIKEMLQLFYDEPETVDDKNQGDG